MDAMNSLDMPKSTKILALKINGPHAKIVDEPRNLASHQEDRHYLRESECYRRPS